MYLDYEVTLGLITHMHKYTHFSLGRNTAQGKTVLMFHRKNGLEMDAISVSTWSLFCVI